MNIYRIEMDAVRLGIEFKNTVPISYIDLCDAEELLEKVLREIRIKIREWEIGNTCNTL